MRLCNYDKEGNPFYNNLECFPLRDASGVVTHFCGALQGEPIEEGTVAKLDRSLDPVVLPARIESDVPGCSSAPEGPKRLKRERQHVRLADALNNSTDAVVMTQAQHPYAITHVNQQWCEMCGYTLEVRARERGRREREGGDAHDKGAATREALPRRRRGCAAHSRYTPVTTPDAATPRFLRGLVRGRRWRA